MWLVYCLGRVFRIFRLGWAAFGSIYPAWGGRVAPQSASRPFFEVGCTLHWWYTKEIPTRPAAPIQTDQSFPSSCILANYINATPIFTGFEIINQVKFWILENTNKNRWAWKFLGFKWTHVLVWFDDLNLWWPVGSAAGWGKGRVKSRLHRWHWPHPPWHLSRIPKVLKKPTSKNR